VVKKLFPLSLLIVLIIGFIWFVVQSQQTQLKSTSFSLLDNSSFFEISLNQDSQRKTLFQEITSGVQVRVKVQDQVPGQNSFYAPAGGKQLLVSDYSLSRSSSQDMTITLYLSPEYFSALRTEIKTDRLNQEIERVMLEAIYTTQGIYTSQALDELVFTSQTQLKSIDSEPYFEGKLL